VTAKWRHRGRAEGIGIVGWRLRQWGWGIAILALLFGVLGATVFAAARPTGGSAQTIDGIACESGERLEYHVHAHVAIYVNGEQLTVPAGTGITNSCIYWLHTHDFSGVIHIESPAQQNFTLGQFFAVWGQTLSAEQLMSYSADASHQVQAYVNGQPWSGDPASIPLDAHAVIVLEYGPPFVSPPSYEFPFGL
jgi:hypothetical protein